MRSNIGSAVSRRLRAAGWNISPIARKYQHYGIFVSAQGDRVSVFIDLDRSIAYDTTRGIRSEVSQWPGAGNPSVRHNDDGSVTFAFTYAPPARGLRKAGAAESAAKTQPPVQLPLW